MQGFAPKRRGISCGQRNGRGFASEQLLDDSLPRGSGWAGESQGTLKTLRTGSWMCPGDLRRFAIEKSKLLTGVCFIRDKLADNRTGAQVQFEPGAFLRTGF